MICNDSAGKNDCGSGGITALRSDATGAVSNAKITISEASEVTNGPKFRKKSVDRQPPTFDLELTSKKLLRMQYPISNIQVKLPVTKDAVMF